LAFIVHERSIILLGIAMHSSYHFTTTTTTIVITDIITRSHGSVSVVRTTSKVNGKCHISGYASNKTPGSIFKKICRVDYVADPTPHANIGVNRFKGSMSA